MNTSKVFVTNTLGDGIEKESAAHLMLILCNEIFTAVDKR